MTKLADEIESVAGQTGFSGVVSIKHADTDIFTQPYGYRNIKDKHPNRETTRFGIASGTKLFTALSIGKLIDNGNLSLKTTMKEIDDDYRSFIDAEATILQLLTHTSGIYDYYDEEQVSDFDNYTVEIPWSYLTTPFDYWPLFKDKKMKFHSGERYSYSNGGYVFLGILIEKVTGELFRDFVTANVLRCAGMNDLGFFAFNDLPADTAIGYLADRKTSNIYNLPIRGGGDGGMYTTVADMQSFWKVLLSNEILSSELTGVFLQTHSIFDDMNGYGCGIYKKLDDSVYSIEGGDAGVGFYSRHSPRESMTISVLSNKTNGEGRMVKCILEILEND